MHHRPAATFLIVVLGAAFAPAPTLGASAGPVLTVDVRKDRHAISPDIYGVNFADTAHAHALGLTVDRWGGNSTSRYDFLTGFHNTGADWYFENIPPDSSSTLPHEAFIDGDRGAGLASLITMPLIGWTPKAGSPTEHPYACGFKTATYGAQDSTDPWDPPCGNGVHNGHQVTGNDPTDTSTQIDAAWVGDRVDDLVEEYGTAAEGGVSLYELDNEPSLWNSTHRDVHPAAVTYDELLERTVDYASAVKAADLGAKTLGPSDWGWCAYFYSAADPGGCQDGSDRQSHGDQAFVPWYLSRLSAYEQAHDARLLDYLDEHYYPQNGVALQPAGDATTQALRLRSTRSLWDPTYIDESWISDLANGGIAVGLIPRMRGWVAAEYPGTKLAITEYNFGGLESLNGALTQADVLGIFGREGLDLATLWAPGASNEPWAYAFRMFRDYDGSGATFATTCVRARSFDASQPGRVNGGQDRLSIYATQRSNGTLTVMLINKTGKALSSGLTLKGFTPGSAAQVWRYSGADPHHIVRAANLHPSGNTIQTTYPARSITLLVIPSK
jgi:Glycoside hydrolase family 44